MGQHEAIFELGYFEGDRNQRALFVIMISALRNDQLLVFDRINQPVFVVNSSAPESGPFKLERLRLADAIERIS